jgi:type I restriction enzyme S subunit
MAETKKLIPKRRFKEFQNSEAWEQCKLGEISSLITKGTTPINKSGKGEINYIKVENIDPSSGEINVVNRITLEEHNNYLKRSQLKMGDILFSIAGTLGRVTSVDSSVLPANTNQALAIIRLKVKSLDYVKIFLKGKAVSNYIKKNPTIGAQPNLSLEQVGNLEIDIPTIDEQIKIGQFFRKLDKLITLHQRKLDKIKSTKKAYLYEMFPAEGESKPKRRFKGFSEDWEQCKLGKLTNVSSAARVHKEEWTSTGVPFFRSSDVVSAYKGNENDKAFISFELYKKLIGVSGKLEKDDILITGGGSIGIPYFVPNNKPLYSKDADLIWVKSSVRFDSRYLFTYFTTPEFRKYLSSISHIGTIAHYTIEQVRETPIYLPSIIEQNAIGKHFENLDKLIALHQHKLDKLKNLKKSYLNEMFI